MWNHRTITPDRVHNAQMYKAERGMVWKLKRSQVDCSTTFIVFIMAPLHVIFRDGHRVSLISRALTIDGGQGLLGKRIKVSIPVHYYASHATPLKYRVGVEGRNCYAPTTHVNRTK